MIWKNARYNWTCGVVALACMLGCCLHAHAQSPTEVGTAFCLALTQNTPEKIMPLLSHRLQQKISQAQAASDAWGLAHPGEKPPLGDGIAYKTYPDFTPLCHVTSVDAGRTRAKVRVEHAFAPGDKANWQDELRLIWQAGDWRIDDVRYADDHYRHGLVQALGSTIRDSR